MGFVLSVSPIVARIDALQLFRVVGGIADYSAAASGKQHAPSAYVLPVESNALTVGGGELSRYGNAVSQRISDAFAVIYLARNVSDPRGDAAQEELGHLRNAVIDTLVGWVPPGADSEFLYRRGRIEDFDNQTIVWRDEFITERNFEK